MFENNIEHNYSTYMIRIIIVIIYLYTMIPEKDKAMLRPRKAWPECHQTGPTCHVCGVRGHLITSNEALRSRFCEEKQS